MDTTYLHRLRLGLVLASVTLPYFCSSLDRAFIGTVLPDIIDYFKSLSDIGMYGAA